MNDIKKTVLTSRRSKPGSIVTALLWVFLLSLVITPAEAANKAPIFKGRDLNRDSVNLEEMIKEGPVLITFWATCCSNTITLMNQVEKLHQKYTGHGFTVLGIAENDSKTVSQVKPWVKARRLTLPVILDPDGKILRLYHVQATPHLILVSKEGAITFSHSGYLAGDEKLFEIAIRKTLGLGDEGVQSE